MRIFVPVFFFTPIGIVYLFGITPDMTWFSLGGDQFDYVVASKNFCAARPTSYPLLICLGWLFERLPGNDFWNLALLSAIASLVTCVFIFVTIRYLLRTRSGWPYSLAPYIGSAAYAASFPVWTQSVIPEVYTLSTMLMVMGAYFVVTRHFYIAAMIFALSLGTHHTIAFALIPCLVYVWWLKRKGETGVRFRWLFLIGALGLLLYLQPILCVNYPRETTNGMGVIVSQSGGTLPFVGQLGISYVPSRLWEFLVVMLPGCGVSLVLLFFLPRGREVLLYLVMALLPIVYYLVSVPPQWVTFLVPGVAFLSVLVGVGASYFPVRQALPVVLCFLLLGVGANLWFYDIGRNVDPAPTTARQMYEELDKVPDGAYVYTHTWGHGWMLTYYYCVEHDWRFTMINQGGVMFHQPWYMDEMEDRGVVVPDYCFEERMPSGFLWRTPDTGNFNMYEFVSLLMDKNPDKDIWMCYLESESAPMKFNVARIERLGNGKCGIPMSVVPIMIHSWEGYR